MEGYREALAPTTLFYGFIPSYSQRSVDIFHNLIIFDNVFCIKLALVLMLNYFRERLSVHYVTSKREQIVLLYMLQCRRHTNFG